MLWVPCIVYSRKREREKEREHNHNQKQRNRKERKDVCMKNAWTCDMQNLICIMGKNSIQTYKHTFNNIKHTSKCMKLVKMQWECNAWAYNIKTKTPNPKISQKISKTQNFSKTLKPRLKMHKCMKMKGFRKLTKWSKLDKGRKCSE